MRLVERPNTMVMAVALLAKLLGAGAVAIFFGGTLFSDDRANLDAIVAYTTGEDTARCWPQARRFI